MTSSLRPVVPPGRGVFCNRTLNLRAVRAIGYDMDYTLVHYHVDAWEHRAYAYLQQKLVEFGWPVDDLTFPASFAMRGLVVDTELGNLVKADRFGYVKRASHGTRRLEFDEQRRLYSRVLLDLTDPRWVFLNTFFSLSEASMYAQLVDRLDAQRFGAPGLGYAELWRRVHDTLDSTHAEGRLKQEIMTQPDRYLQPDPDLPRTLLDQKQSGKRLLLITNSDWFFTRAMMSHCVDRFMPAGLTWRDLFELTIVSARKPEFFSERGPLFEIVDDAGLVRPCIGAPVRPGVYLGGHAALIEAYLGVSGAEILFIGDHLYTDVRLSKEIRRWRTGLIVRELEEELVEVAAIREKQARLDALMAEKSRLEFEQAQVRLRLLRLEHAGAPSPQPSLPERGRGASSVWNPERAVANEPPAARPATTSSGRPDRLEAQLGRLRARHERLDAEIGPLAAAVGSIFNPTWGPLMSTGADRSHLARQLEESADIYTSRVSNLLFQTPFAFLRAPRGRMPHDLALDRGDD